VELIGYLAPYLAIRIPPANSGLYSTGLVAICPSFVRATQGTNVFSYAINLAITNSSGQVVQYPFGQWNTATAPISAKIVPSRLSVIHSPSQAWMSMDLDQTVTYLTGASLSTYGLPPMPVHGKSYWNQLYLDGHATGVKNPNSL
jgi:hypothetical protein